jgi:hypothetical protein
LRITCVDTREVSSEIVDCPPFQGFCARVCVVLYSSYIGLAYLQRGRAE